MRPEPLLSVRNLSIEFNTERGVVRAVDDVSFDVAPGETLGVVGESGCGKTVTALALMRLIPSPPGRVVSGSIRLAGRDILAMSEKDMRDIRGSEVSMIFQEPMTALNPVFTIGNQMIDVIRRHEALDRKSAKQRALEMLERVGIPIPDKRISEYPHELSGGMRQRVMIAMALSCGPKLLIADEPTTALDVTTQAQVMEQIVKLQEDFGMAVMLITHDLGVIAESCRRALVMYCGQMIEDAAIEQLFAQPQHPYTQGLLRSIPRIREQKLESLPVIEGTVPDLLHLPAGCRFADRCPRATTDCHESQPPLVAREQARVACFHPGLQDHA
ncbi:MAG: ABC transporter ATP-binding protein [Gammaproteobacteria bacterium]|nr:ABC transporter ATP-binding protein [Gammaproteobacteria bacterium]MDH3769167.1 ABC transporter ATP-binding protein [Gammaproteobacteria bacterium]